MKQSIGKKVKGFLLGLMALVAIIGCASDKQQDAKLKLWYTAPASEWTAALPIGNGRLGAMVYGGINEEHLQLNEETLWSGGPHSYDKGVPKYQMAYQPLGDLFLTFPEGEQSTNYRRELDLQNAVSKVTYTIGGAQLRNLMNRINQVMRHR